MLVVKPLKKAKTLTEKLLVVPIWSITAGMGGGSGTVELLLLARIAKDLGALIVGVVTLLFGFEKEERGQFAVEGISIIRVSM